MLAEQDMQAISLLTYFNRGNESSSGLNNGALADERTGFLLHRLSSYVFSPTLSFRESNTLETGLREDLF